MHLRSFASLALMAAIVLTGCKDQPKEEEAVQSEIPVRPTVEGTADVQVFFHQEEQLLPVWRKVQNADPQVYAALEALVKGPTPEERSRGVTSFFSQNSAGSLEAVVVEAGTAVVDFRRFPQDMAGASSAAGSELLLAELNSTVFRYSGIQRVVYRFNGSCEEFWNWLQRKCEIVPRPAAAPTS